MATEDFKRKLTAVFSADVVGYSRLMGEDEAETVRTLETHKGVMFSLIKQHRGRVVDSTGDNLLAEFGSVVDAVQCAVAVQKELQARNASLTENRKMQFRIGINLGDVIEEQDRIYGDGVNIAARLEALADPGGICISKTAFDQIESKLPLGYQFLGEQSVKNIAKPIGAYRVMMEPRVTGSGEKEIERASEEKMAYPLPDKPSIAVLPFWNMSGDPNQDFIGDAITEQIITYLSMSPDMFVIAMNSVFTYKGKPVKIQKVAEELGVRYVLEGSFQSAENRLRITVQLIDALTGKHLWAERYDKDLKDLFVVQDEITVNIFHELQVKLVWGEYWRKYFTSRNIDHLQKRTKAWSYFLDFTPDSMEQAHQLYEELILSEAGDAGVHNMIAWTHWFRVYFGSSKSPDKDISRAFEMAQKAIALNDSYGHPHCLLGYIYLFFHHRYEKAVSEMEQAVAKAPNDAECRAHMASVFNFIGRNEEAINLAKQAIRLNPFPQSYYLEFLGKALCFAGQYKEAIEAHKKALSLNPKYLYSMIGLTIAYSLSGQEEEARAMAADILMIEPSFSIKRHEMRSPYKNRADTELMINALRKAGLPG